MKAWTIFLASTLCLIYSTALAQTPEKIEAELLKSFKKINYWYIQKAEDTTGIVIDSLGSANDAFRGMLGGYACEYPLTIKLPFDSLTNAGLDILTSSDGQLRIYSWDMGTGGTQGAASNIFQYKTGTKTDTSSDVSSDPLGSPATFKKIYQFTANGKTYYPIVYEASQGIIDRWEGIMIFAIQHGKLDSGVNLIKTTSGLNSYLSCYFRGGGTEINFNAKTKTIKFPLIDENNLTTDESIVYKFNGRYFIRVKN